MAPPEVSPGDVAIVGMACRVPGAATYADLWRMLVDGREGRSDLDDDELRRAGEPESLLSDPAYVKAGMFLESTRQFDPGFFGFSPLDGRILDPQHRQFLECAWEAFEDAGFDPGRPGGPVGVFAGSGHHVYYAQHLLTNRPLVEEVGHFLLRHTGNDKDFLATRASYCFNLHGPSINVQTACSTSAVAIHAAVQSLLTGECDLALAGAVTIELPHRVGYLYRPSEILSPDGHCRPFDASAGGTVFGSGVAIVVLKKAEQAVEDGDHIHAIIKGSAVNNDGSAKVSYLAPSVDGQVAVIAEALAMAAVDADTVSYVEAHGTGTPMGDPIEVAALAQAYVRDSPDRSPCGLGSVKSNIGHLDTAAGAVSLIKVALSLQHRQLPSTLHYSAPNPAIELARTSFFVVDRLRPWHGPAPLRAGVSSLGVGGTNAHLVVEEAPARPAGSAGRELELVVMSARTSASLSRARQRMARCLDETWLSDDQAATGFADAAYTLATGRRAFRHRLFGVFGNRLEAADALADANSARIGVGEALARPGRVAFMFAGGGSQYPAMGQDLYARAPVFRAALDRCLSVLRQHTDLDLRPFLFPPSTADRGEAARALERPSVALPALFATQYAQALLWRSWGVEPHVLIGHSMGENTAACLAGVFSLEDALGLVALRGRLFEQVAPGAMLSLELDEASVVPLLRPGLGLAAVNAPGLTVVSGTIDAVGAFQRDLEARGIGCQRVRIDVAAHSEMLDPILKDFRAYLRSISLRPPTIPFPSNVTGRWIEAAEATDPEYWVRHLRNTVRFADGIGELFKDDSNVLLEVGPGRTLASLAAMNPAKRTNSAIVTSMRHPDDDTSDLAHMLGALGRLWVNGIEPDWTRFYEGQRRLKVPLPTYSFDHVDCWIEPGATSSTSTGPASEDWLYEPVWRSTTTRRPWSGSGSRVLVIDEDAARLHALEAGLTRAGAAVRLVRASDRYSFEGVGPCQIRPNVADDYLRLLDACHASGWTPTHVIHGLALSVEAGADSSLLDVDTTRAFDSLLFLAQAFGSGASTPLQWLVLTHRVWQVGGEAPHSPVGALASGLANTLPREFPAWSTRVVDLEGADLSSPTIVERILAEFAEPADEAGDQSLVALRGARGFRRHWLTRPSETRSPGHTTRRPDAVYLITGGTGGLGLAAAAMLAQQGSPLTLVLVSRRPWPANVHWAELIKRDAPEAGTLKNFLALEASGARVVLETADLSDEPSVAALVARTTAASGPIHGVIHAAGIADDAPLVSKDIARAHAVLAPKVRGVIALARAFAPGSLDFFIVYSSSSSFAGLPGQVDYAAANAFLDAFAAWARESGVPCQAINWPAWRHTGLAASLAAGAAPRPRAGGPAGHPLLDRCTDDGPERRVFTTQFSVAHSWVIAEHRLKNGPALMPGFGFLEMARAAWAEGRLDRDAFEMADVSIEFPFIVPDNAVRWLSAEVSATTGDFTMVSDDGDGRTEHARGVIRQASATDSRLDLEQVRLRCTAGQQRFDDPDHHPFLEFGPRWASLVSVSYGFREAVLDLQLAPPFERDLDDFVIHPALLDMAAAGAQVVIDGYVASDEVFVPVGLRRLWCSGRFPSTCVSHVTFKPGPPDGSREVARFDVRIADSAGRVFLEIDDFEMRRLSSTEALRRLPTLATPLPSPSLKRALELGIEPADGARLLKEIIEGGRGPQLAVAPIAPLTLVSELRDAARPPAAVAIAPAFDPDDDPAIALVEAALSTCAAIDQVVVRSFQGEQAGRRLVAFFVPNADNFVTQSEIRRYARESLDPGQVPHQFVEVDELHDVSGSVDRRALNDPLAPVDRLVPPRTSTEKAIARIWQDALGVAAVGLTDNFFDLGGHSLLSARIIVQIGRRFGVRLSQATMALGTLEQLARDVERRATDVPA